MRTKHGLVSVLYNAALGVRACDFVACDQVKKISCGSELLGAESEVVMFG